MSTKKALNSILGQALRQLYFQGCCSTSRLRTLSLTPGRIRTSSLISPELLLEYGLILMLCWMQRQYISHFLRFIRINEILNTAKIKRTIINDGCLSEVLVKSVKLPYPLKSFTLTLMSKPKWSDHQSLLLSCSRLPTILMLLIAGQNRSFAYI